MVKKIFLYGMLVTFLFTGCKKKGQPEFSSGFEVKGDTIYVAKDHLISEKLKTVSVEEVPYTKEIITSGTIEAIPTQYAYIAPPFAGRVVKSYINLGQLVQVNTPLFEIISPDFIAAQKEFYQSQSERDLAAKDLQRKVDLIKNGVGSQKELEEAQNTLKIAEKEYENAYAALRTFQVDPENMVLGQPLIIRSPISGKIIENNLVTGQYLKDDAEPVAIVADLSKVWITAQVKEKDLARIEKENELHIEIPSLPEKKIGGKVFHISEAIDEETRSFKVLSECNNEDNLLKLGMYVSIHFNNKPANYILIPEKALLQDEHTSFVYLKTEPNTYIKKNIEVDLTKDGNAIILSGLNKGDIIIGEGGFYIN